MNIIITLGQRWLKVVVVVGGIFKLLEIVLLRQEIQDYKILLVQFTMKTRGMLMMRMFTYVHPRLR